MGTWNLRDKDGRFRSRRAYKQDARQVSQEPHEQEYQKRKKQEQTNKKNTKNTNTQGLFSFKRSANSYANPRGKKVEKKLKKFI